MYFSLRMPSELVGTWKIDFKSTRSYEKNSSFGIKRIDNNLVHFNRNTYHIIKRNGRVILSDFENDHTTVYRCKIIEQTENTIILLYEAESGALNTLFKEQYTIVSPNKFELSDPSAENPFYVIYKRVKYK